MESLLKTAEVQIDGVGKLKIRELSAKAFFELSGKSNNESIALVCHHGVVAWNGETLDAITDAVPMRLLSQIALKIYELSGVDAAKNSEPAQSDGSSSV